MPGKKTERATSRVNRVMPAAATGWLPAEAVTEPAAGATTRGKLRAEPEPQLPRRTHAAPPAAARRGDRNGSDGVAHGGGDGSPGRARRGGPNGPSGVARRGRADPPAEARQGARNGSDGVADGRDDSPGKVRRGGRNGSDGVADGRDDSPGKVRRGGRNGSDGVAPRGRDNPRSEPPPDVPPDEARRDDQVEPPGRRRPAHAPGPDLRTAVRTAVAAKLPATLRGARYSPGRRGWRALVVVALLAALISGGLWWRGRSVPAEVPPVTAATSQAPASSTSSAPAKRIVVDVAGKVRRPGIVRLPAGSRVIDAIRAAGGLRPGAKTVGLNLARKLSDGEQILVDVPAAVSQAATVPPGTGGPAGTAGPKIDLNAADLTQLEELPGVGPVLAQRIIDYRTKHGGFQAVNELKDVSGIGPARYADISSRVQV
ncbi:MAG: ComEA family DNA-binding protein [Streptosporangiales bacterium]|nr:ComEA family DNA-binding protein [Streptosporangiales bacterium]